MHEDDKDQPLDVGGLYMNRVPRGGLEDEVVNALKVHGSIRQARTRGPVYVWGLRAAAAVVLFFAGWSSATVAGGVPVADLVSPGGGQYMLLLWEGPEFRPDESLAVEYGAWGQAVAESGVALSGDELGLRDGMFGPDDLRSGESAAGPGPSNEYRLGGYFMVDADEAEATRLARGHPHLKYGGWVEVVPVVRR